MHWPSKQIATGGLTGFVTVSAALWERYAASGPAMDGGPWRFEKGFMEEASHTGTEYRSGGRSQILAAFTAQLDRMIPEDERVPLKGATFADFEDRVETAGSFAEKRSADPRVG